MTQKTSLLDKERTIELLEEFMKYARRGLVDVLEVKHEDGVFEISTQVILKMKELRYLQPIEEMIK